MSAPLPEALRARFQLCIEESLSGRAAALRLKLLRHGSPLGSCDPANRERGGSPAGPSERQGQRRTGFRTCHRNVAPVAWPPREPYPPVWRRALPDRPFARRSCRPRRSAGARRSCASVPWRAAAKRDSACMHRLPTLEGRVILTAADASAAMDAMEGRTCRSPKPRTKA